MAIRRRSTPAEQGRSIRCRAARQSVLAKSPYGSFGKHVLTEPFADLGRGGDAPGWRVGAWDENLLQGSSPADPVPQVVGITVHLTFARRAVRAGHLGPVRGATVILGGIHVNSLADEAAPHADAISLGDGVQTWPAILRDVERGALRRATRGDVRPRGRPRPVAVLLGSMPAAAFLWMTSVVASARLPQPAKVPRSRH